MSYTPETVWRIVNNGELVYNLKISGSSSIENDVSISVQAPTEELRVEIAKLVCDTLNARYPVEHTYAPAVDFRLIDKFEELRRNDPLVSAIVRSGGTPKDCIIALAEKCAQLSKCVVELQAIAPFKISTLDGKVLIWRCPKKFIPERDLQKPGD